ncbi:MAG: hypothetical protein MJZ93_04385 [Paludibacteraceae bacterium]|nr:hypothetical protein [Paludibacteraceae bacterium]
MPSNLKIVIDRPDSDDKRDFLIIFSSKGSQEVEETKKADFLRIVKPLNLKNPEGTFIIASSIVYGNLIDNCSIAKALKSNDFDNDISKLFDLLLDIDNLSNIENMRISFKIKDRDNIQSFNLPHFDFYKVVIDGIINTYRNNFIQENVVKGYNYINMDNIDFMREESYRLKQTKLFHQEHFQHRPNSNNHSYALLILFFTILKITPNKVNCNIMIELFQLFGLWKEGLDITPNSYKLIIRQYDTASKKYQLIFKKGIFQDSSVYKGIELDFEDFT